MSFDTETFSLFERDVDPIVEVVYDDPQDYASADSWSVYWTYDPYKTDREILCDLMDRGVAVDGRRCHHEYDCCGHAYCSRVRIVRMPMCALAIQRAYLNI